MSRFRFCLDYPECYHLEDSVGCVQNDRPMLQEEVMVRNPGGEHVADLFERVVLAPITEDEA